jgi:hypothetical protein
MGDAPPGFGWFKIKHVDNLQRLFTAEPGGFLKRDLQKIVLCDSIYKLIMKTLKNDKKTPWNPRFIWQVEQFPRQYGQERHGDILLAIAKDTEFCAVITISKDFSNIWYRMYKYDVKDPGDFGSLMWAYTQYADDRGRVSSIFVSFVEHYGLTPDRYTLRDEPNARQIPPKEVKEWGTDGYSYSKIYMELQLYDIEHDLQTYSATSVHVDNSDDPDEISFYGETDHNRFGLVGDATIDRRYDQLFEYRTGPEGSKRNIGWYLHPEDLIRDCIHRPTQETPWKLASDVLAAEISSSIMRNFPFN